MDLKNTRSPILFAIDSWLLDLLSLKWEELSKGSGVYPANLFGKTNEYIRSPGENLICWQNTGSL